jgi:mitogen-activated protein kinase 1/3
MTQDIMKPTARDSYNDVYLVYELMDTDLHQIIRSQQTLTNEHFQYFVYREYLHHLNTTCLLAVSPKLCKQQGI